MTCADEYNPLEPYVHCISRDPFHKGSAFHRLGSRAVTPKKTVLQRCRKTSETLVVSFLPVLPTRLTTCPHPASYK